MVGLNEKQLELLQMAKKHNGESVSFIVSVNVMKLMVEGKLSPGAAKFYMYMKLKAALYNAEGIEIDFSLVETAKELGVTDRTVSTWKKELEEFGLFSVRGNTKIALQ